MKILFCVSVFLFLYNTQISAQANFAMDYALENWSIHLSEGSNGTVNYVDAPQSVTIIGSDGELRSNADIDFTITISLPGIYSFDWQYFTNHTGGNPQYDIAGILINGAFVQLSGNTAGTFQTGTYSSSFLAPGTVIGFRVRAIDNLSGNAIFNISNFSTPQILLPVLLNYFNGNPLKNIVQLYWGTSAESGTGFFEIEKSSDGILFSHMEKIPWKGNTTTPAHYHTSDHQPFAGVNFYRLKQVDANGMIHYSKVVKVNLHLPSTVKVSPNPATEKIRLQWTNNREGNESINLFDNNGKLLDRRIMAEGRGQSSADWNISTIPPGIYFFRLDKAGDVVRFIKQ